MGSFRNHSFPCFSSSREGFGTEILSLIPWFWGCACALRPCNTNSVGAGQIWEGPTSTPRALYGQSPGTAQVGFLSHSTQGISQARPQLKVVRWSRTWLLRTLGSSLYGKLAWVAVSPRRSIFWPVTGCHEWNHCRSVLFFTPLPVQHKVWNILSTK